MRPILLRAHATIQNTNRGPPASDPGLGMVTAPWSSWTGKMSAPWHRRARLLPHPLSPMAIKTPWRWSFHPFSEPFFATSTWSVTTLRHWLAADSTGHLEIPRAHSLIVTVHCICTRFHHHLPRPPPTAPDHATTGCWLSVSFLSNGVCHWWRVV
jgi:hypothetical protein